MKYLRFSLILVNFGLINVQKLVVSPLNVAPLLSFVGVWGEQLAGSCATFSCGRVQPSTCGGRMSLKCRVSLWLFLPLFVVRFLEDENYCSSVLMIAMSCKQGQERVTLS